MILLRSGDSLELKLELFDEDTNSSFSLKGWTAGAYLSEDTGAGSSPFISLQAPFGICQGDNDGNSLCCGSEADNIIRLFIPKGILNLEGKYYFLSIKIENGNIRKTIFFSEVFIDKNV